MIKFVDSETEIQNYRSACGFDPVYGTINASLERLYRQNNQGFFWNIYDHGKCVGNLSFVKDGFTLCTLKKVSEETAEFIRFWENFQSVKSTVRNAEVLYGYFQKNMNIKIGKILIMPEIIPNYRKLQFDCKASDIHSFYRCLCQSFDLNDTPSAYREFYYDMHYRVRHHETALYGVFYQNTPMSVCEVLAENPQSVVLGALCTDPLFRNQGSASTLLSYVREQYRGKTCFVLSESTDSTLFYLHNGCMPYHDQWAELTV